MLYKTITKQYFDLLHNGRSGGILPCGLNTCGEKSCYTVRWSSLSVVSIMNTSSTPHAAFVGWNCGKFICLPSGMDKIRYKIYPQNKTTHRPSNCAARRKLWLVYGCKWIFIHPFHIHFSIWVKFLIRPCRIFCCWTDSSLLQIDDGRADFS